MKVKEFLSGIDDALAARFADGDPYPREEVIRSLVNPTLRSALKGCKLPFTWKLKNHVYDSFDFVMSQKEALSQFIGKVEFQTNLYLTFGGKKLGADGCSYPCSVSFHPFGLSSELTKKEEDMELSEFLLSKYNECLASFMMREADEIIPFANALSFLDKHGITINEFIDQARYALDLGNSAWPLKPAMYVTVSPSWAKRGEESTKIPYMLYPEAFKRVLTFLENYFKENPAYEYKNMDKLVEAKNAVSDIQPKFNRSLYFGVCAKSQVKHIKAGLEALTANVNKVADSTDDDIYVESALVPWFYCGDGTTDLNWATRYSYDELQKEVSGPGVWYAYDRGGRTLSSGNFSVASEIPNMENSTVMVLYGDDILETDNG